MEQLKAEYIQTWPQKVARIEDIRRLNNGLQVEYQNCMISQSYFNKIVRKLDNVAFYKNPTFTKCNICVALRNIRRKTSNLAKIADIKDARTKHNHLVLSEVVTAEPGSLNTLRRYLCCLCTGSATPTTTRGTCRSRPLGSAESPAY
jgi:hypothetical protein